jgi:hypothetical protein
VSVAAPALALHRLSRASMMLSCSTAPMAAASSAWPKGARRVRRHIQLRTVCASRFASSAPASGCGCGPVGRRGSTPLRSSDGSVAWRWRAAGEAGVDHARRPAAGLCGTHMCAADSEERAQRARGEHGASSTCQGRTARAAERRQHLQPRTQTNTGGERPLEKQAFTTRQAVQVPRAGPAPPACMRPARGACPWAQRSLLSAARAGGTRRRG